MHPLIPDRATFLAKPSRVSRLYPILSLVLLLIGSGVIYRWQLTQINADSAVQERDKTIQILTGQVETLSAQQKRDQATLAEQQDQIKKTTDQLTSIESQLQSATTELTARQQELKDAQSKVAQQQQQLSSTATELEKLRTRPPLFSFQNSTSRSDAAEMEAELKDVVSTAYDYIQQLYGTPYLLNQITISFVDELSIAGSAGEITIENGSKGISITIKIKQFDKNTFQDVNTIIHEIIHGFHGVAVLESSAFEEGMTVAATDAVMERMIADGKLPQFKHLYITVSASTYTQWNSTLVIHNDNTEFYQSSDIAKIYQLTGQAWLNFYRQDGDFFKKLNDRYYKDVQNGKLATNDLIKSHITAILDSVAGTPIKMYLSNNIAFNPR